MRIARAQSAMELSPVPSRKYPTENPSGNVRQDSGAFARQQSLNAAGADHLWKFSPLNGFNYHQLASTQALVRNSGVATLGHAGARAPANRGHAPPVQR